MKRVARHSIPGILLPAASSLSVASFDAMEPNALIFLTCVGAVSSTVGLLALSHTLRFAHIRPLRIIPEPMQKGRTMNGGPIRREDEVAIRQLVQDMQEAQNTKNGELFASAFAQEHDYVAINGMLLPNQTREDNARVHQRLYDESRSSVTGRHVEVEVSLNVAKIRLLTAPEVTVAHVESEFRLKDQAEKKTKNIVTAVMQKQEGEWEIVAFHTAPVQKRNEEGTGFVIQVEGL